MNWENDSKMIMMILGILLLFIVFGSFMVIRFTKNKTTEQSYSGNIRLTEVKRRDTGNSILGLGLIIFITATWLFSTIIIFFLYDTNHLSNDFQIPKILTFPYDILGSVGGVIIQIVLSSIIIITSIRLIIRRKRNHSGYTLN